MTFLYSFCKSSALLCKTLPSQLTELPLPLLAESRSNDLLAMPPRWNSVGEETPPYFSEIIIDEPWLPRLFTGAFQVGSLLLD